MDLLPTTVCAFIYESIKHNRLFNYLFALCYGSTVDAGNWMGHLYEELHVKKTDGNNYAWFIQNCNGG